MIEVNGSSKLLGTVAVFRPARSLAHTDANLPLRFGPILSAGGRRRLNVATTRAKEKVIVVSSFVYSPSLGNNEQSERALPDGCHVRAKTTKCTHKFNQADS